MSELHIQCQKFKTGLSFAVVSHLQRRAATCRLDGAEHTTALRLNFGRELLVCSCVQFHLCAHGGMAGGCSFCCSEILSTEKWLPTRKVNPCWPIEQDFIRHAEVALVFINCLFLHNTIFGVLRKMEGEGRGWEKREDSGSGVSRDTKAEGGLKGIHNIKLMRKPLASWRLLPRLTLATALYTLWLGFVPTMYQEPSRMAFKAEKTSLDSQNRGAQRLWKYFISSEGKNKCTFWKNQ